MSDLEDVGELLKKRYDFDTESEGEAIECAFPRGFTSAFDFRRFPRCSPSYVFAPNTVNANGGVSPLINLSYVSVALRAPSERAAAPNAALCELFELENRFYERDLRLARVRFARVRPNAKRGAATLKALRARGESSLSAERRGRARRAALFERSRDSIAETLLCARDFAVEAIDESEARRSIVEKLAFAECGSPFMRASVGSPIAARCVLRVLLSFGTFRERQFRILETIFCKNLAFFDDSFWFESVVQNCNSPNRGDLLEILKKCDLQTENCENRFDFGEANFVASLEIGQFIVTFSRIARVLHEIERRFQKRFVASICGEIHIEKVIFAIARAFVERRCKVWAQICWQRFGAHFPRLESELCGLSAHFAALQSHFAALQSAPPHFEIRRRGCELLFHAINA